MATDYTPYEGAEILGRPKTVAVRGSIVVADGELVDSVARGRHVPAGAVELSMP
jgi:dihydropyrimidinase